MSFIHNPSRPRNPNLPICFHTATALFNTLDSTSSVIFDIYLTDEGPLLIVLLHMRMHFLQSLHFFSAIL